MTLQKYINYEYAHKCFFVECYLKGLYNYRKSVFYAIQ